jgi:hypothetical protein
MDDVGLCLLRAQPHGAVGHGHVHRMALAVAEGAENAVANRRPLWVTIRRASSRVRRLRRRSAARIVLKMDISPLLPGAVLTGLRRREAVRGHSLSIDAILCSSHATTSSRLMRCSTSANIMASTSIFSRCWLAARR